MDFKKAGKLFIPEHMQVPELTTSPIPLSLWMNRTNQLFYTRDENELSALGTLGKNESLLPRALAKDLEGRTAPIHEIGPGNFSFATTLTEAADQDVFVHDFSDRFYGHMKDRLPSTVHFQKNAFGSFPSTVSDDPLTVVGVELLDDLPTEFFAVNEGKTGIFFVQPSMQGDLSFPSKAKYAKEQVREGNFSLATQTAVGGAERQYTATEIIDMISNVTWDDLSDIHPSFLTELKIKNMSAIEMPLEQTLQLHWKDMPEAFFPFARDVLEVYKKQLESAQGTAADKQVIHLPFSALAFLWKMRGRDVRMDFFDYGYENTGKWLDAFSVYSGQITAPVNFELLQASAEVLGFSTRLERNSRFIERTLGVDAIGMNYVLKALPEKFRRGDHKHLVYSALFPAMQSIYDESLEGTDISMRRVPRAHPEALFEEMHKQGLVSELPVIDEGSFHLTIYR